MECYLRVDKRTGCDCWQMRYHSGRPDNIRKVLDFVTCCMPMRKIFIAMATWDMEDGFLQISEKVRKEKN